MRQQIVEVPFVFVSSTLESKRHKNRDTFLTRGTVAGRVTILEDGEFPVVMRVLPAMSRLTDGGMAEEEALRLPCCEIRRSEDGQLWSSSGDGNALEAITQEPVEDRNSALSGIKWGDQRRDSFRQRPLVRPDQVTGVSLVTNRKEREQQVLAELETVIVCGGLAWTPTTEPVLIAEPHHSYGSVSVQRGLFGERGRRVFGLDEMDAALAAASENGQQENTYMRGAVELIDRSALTQPWRARRMETQLGEVVSSLGKELINNSTEMAVAVLRARDKLAVTPAEAGAEPTYAAAAQSILDTLPDRDRHGFRHFEFEKRMLAAVIESGAAAADEVTRLLDHASGDQAAALLP